MKKLYSTIMLLAMMVTALSFTACGDDEEEENGSSSSTDFIEVTVNGKTYRENIFGVYTQFQLGDEDMVFTGLVEDLFYEEGFSLFLGLTHSEKKDKLLSCSPGSYGVSKKIGFDDEPDNLCLYPQFEMHRDIYHLVRGSHQVTSIRKTKKGVQVCGNFSITMSCDDEKVTLKGKYGMTVL